MGTFSEQRRGSSASVINVTHLTEDGVDRRFIQQQVGHRCDTSTAIYTHVSGDFMNSALQRALAPAFTAGPPAQPGAPSGPPPPVVVR